MEQAERTDLMERDSSKNNFPFYTSHLTFVSPTPQQYIRKTFSDQNNI